MSKNAPLATSLDSLPSGLVVLDDRSCPTYVNHQAALLLGDDGDVLLGRCLDEVLPTLMEAVRRTVAAGESEDLQVCGLDGRYRILGLRAGEVRTEDGRAEGHVVVLRDLTEILSRRRQARLGHLAAGADMMATAAQHELRNPLFTATCGLELMLEQTGLSSEQREGLQDVVGELGRMARVLSRLRPETEAVPLAPARDVHRLVVSTVEAYRTLFEAAGKQLHLSLPGALPAPPIDPSRCTMLVGALLQNGLESAPPGSAVEVEGRVSPDGQFLELDVRDQGAVAKDARRADCFALHDSPRSNSTALGLAFARSIAIGAGGDVTLKQPQPGGSTVRLRLPVGGDDVEADPDR